MVKRVKLNKQQVVKKERKQQAYFKPEYNEQVERLCKLGVTDHEVARFFNVSFRTVQNWKHDHPEFFEALHRGKLESDTEVAASLFKNATGFTYQQETLVKKWRKKYNNQGQVVEAYEIIERVFVEQHALPNTTSQIFYLKNRRPDLWRDAHLIKADDGAADKVYTTPDEILTEMKKRGIVMIEGAYTVDNGRTSSAR